MNQRAWIAAALVGAALAVAYARLAGGLVRQWGSDDNYSHGFIVLPLAVWFAWQRRAALRALPLRPSVFGLAVVAAGLAMLMVGVLGAELFLSRLSFVVVVAGTIVFLLGARHLRVLALPLAFLLLMIPLPAIVFNNIAFPLQLLASRAGALALDWGGVPVLREGNMLILASTRLEVAEACSGIRSLVSLLTLAVVLGQLSLTRRWTRVLLALAAAPVAIVANASRVAGTGFAAHFWSPEAADGFFHAFSGWMVFGVAFAALMTVQRLALHFESPAARPQPARGGVPVQA
jgi:exosortase